MSFCRLGAASQPRSDISRWLGAFLVAVDAIDHEFNRVRVGVREDAVAQIEDVAGRGAGCLAGAAGKPGRSSEIGLAVPENQAILCALSGVV